MLQPHNAVSWEGHLLFACTYFFRKVFPSRGRKPSTKKKKRPLQVVFGTQGVNDKTSPGCDNRL